MTSSRDAVGSITLGNPAGGAGTEVVLRASDETAIRWYRAGWGRYTQADPIGLRGGVNLYSYRFARPTALSDRLGLVAWQCRVGVILGAADILGAGVVTGSCSSPCVNGRQRFVQVAGVAGGISVGSPIEISFTDLTLEDGASVPSAQNLSPGLEQSFYSRDGATETARTVVNGVQVASATTYWGHIAQMVLPLLALLVGVVAVLRKVMRTGAFFTWQLVACNIEYGSGESCFMRHDNNDAATDAGRARDLGSTAAVAGAASR